ncbi:MAG: hypothetical protein ACYCQK_02110 [Acidiferrobacteraceae bacterium]
MANSDKGDYALPGDASTYPSGGLHARYSNNLDLASNTYQSALIHAPDRMLSFGTIASGEYANQQDATIDSQANPTPGAGTADWSCIWFGAIWLKLSAGDYTFQITLPAVANNFGVRAYIGKTIFGTDLLAGAGWPASGGAWSNTSGQSYTFTVTAADLAGTLSYDGGTVQRDGWYPIKIEYAVGNTAAAAPVLSLTSSPAAYTDPGGTSIAAGAQTTVVPSTSLSPLGCADQRYQGIAHFDLAQQTAQAFGFQIALEPQALESGSFPGVLAPRLREGQDVDLVLNADRDVRTDGEGVLNYSSTVDAASFASSLWGNGAGFQTGTTGQLQANVFDPATMLASLFDAQQWQDHPDAAFSSLLEALLNSQLALELLPWQLLSADPAVRPRRAFTWPLPGAIAQMRWHPGDGLRVQVPEINVFDTEPRQLLVVTRSFTPLGITGTTVTFADRPGTGG